MAALVTYIDLAILEWQERIRPQKFTVWTNPDIWKNKLDIFCKKSNTTAKSWVQAIRTSPTINAPRRLPKSMRSDVLEFGFFESCSLEEICFRARLTCQSIALHRPQPSQTYWPAERRWQIYVSYTRNSLSRDVRCWECLSRQQLEVWYSSGLIWMYCEEGSQQEVSLTCTPRITPSTLDLTTTCSARRGRWLFPDITSRKEWLFHWVISHRINARIENLIGCLYRLSRRDKVLTGVLSEVLPQPLILSEMAKIVISTLCAMIYISTFY